MCVSRLSPNTHTQIQLPLWHKLHNNHQTMGEPCLTNTLAHIIKSRYEVREVLAGTSGSQTAGGARLSKAHGSMFCILGPAEGFAGHKSTLARLGIIYSSGRGPFDLGCRLTLHQQSLSRSTSLSRASLSEDSVCHKSISVRAAGGPRSVWVASLEPCVPLALKPWANTQVGADYQNTSQHDRQTGVFSSALQPNTTHTTTITRFTHFMKRTSMCNEVQSVVSFCLAWKDHLVSRYVSIPLSTMFYHPFYHPPGENHKSDHTPGAG